MFKSKGFSMIELLITIAIVGILASFAMPAYREYVEKAKVSEVLSAIGKFKLKITDYYNLNGKFPKTLSDAYIVPDTGPDVKYSVSMGAGVLTLRSVENIGNGPFSISLVPVARSNSVSFECMNTTHPQYVPFECDSGTVGAPPPPTSGGISPLPPPPVPMPPPGGSPFGPP